MEILCLKFFMGGMIIGSQECRKRKKGEGCKLSSLCQHLANAFSLIALIVTERKIFYRIMPEYSWTLIFFLLAQMCSQKYCGRKWNSQRQRIIQILWKKDHWEVRYYFKLFFLTYMRRVPLDQSRKKVSIGGSLFCFRVHVLYRGIT